MNPCTNLTYIIAATNTDASNYVNKIGKYLNKQLDGAFKIKFGPMSCEVTIRMYYQVPGQPESLDEMHFLLDIAAYQNKVRVNVTEDTKLENTIGQVILTVDELKDLSTAKKKILTKIRNYIDKQYSEFEFLY